jgi:hypothetical protein
MHPGSCFIGSTSRTAIEFHGIQQENNDVNLLKNLRYNIPPISNDSSRLRSHLTIDAKQYSILYRPP